MRCCLSPGFATHGNSAKSDLIKLPARGAGLACSPSSAHVSSSCADRCGPGILFDAGFIAHFAASCIPFDAGCAWSICSGGGVDGGFGVATFAGGLAGAGPQPGASGCSCRSRRSLRETRNRSMPSSSPSSGAGGAAAAWRRGLRLRLLLRSGHGFGQALALAKMALALMAADAAAWPPGLRLRLLLRSGPSGLGGALTSQLNHVVPGGRPPGALGGGPRPPPSGAPSGPVAQRLLCGSPRLCSLYL